MAGAPPLTLVGHTIQAGAFKEQTNAERFVDSLRKKKLDAVYFRKNNGLFAVTFGNFSSLDAAVQCARRLKKDLVIDHYYVTAPVSHFKPFENRTGAGSTSSKANEEIGKTIARTAERFTGLPYKWGGNNVVEGLDCSGFVKSVYYLVGLNIPRTSQEQFDSGSPVGKGDLMEGDLLFFGKGTRQISHVGMYIGNGRFIHAPRRGEPIQITQVNNEKYVQKYVGSRRFL